MCFKNYNHPNASKVKKEGRKEGEGRRRRRKKKRRKQ